MNYSRKISLLVLAFFALSSGITKAVPSLELNETVQQQTGISVRGKVVDSSGESIIGANVIVKGASKGVATNINGEFVIVVNPGDVLTISYIGYESQRVTANAKSKLNIVLQSNSKQLNEMVVLGYGVQQKKSVIASVSQVKGDELMKSGGVVSVGEALQGKMAGVSAVYTSGRPGQKNIRYYIRGQSSWNNGGQPLVLIDGIEGSLEDVDVNEIENISVLKDASATAVYGVKGASGVILLTTKRGQVGKAEMSFSTNISYKSVSKLPEQMDSYDAADMANRTILNELSYNNSSWGSYMPSQIMDKYRNQVTQRDKEAFPNVNWSDYLLKDKAADQRVEFSVRGGSDFVKYFCNISYQHESDIFKHFDNHKGYDSGFDYNRINYRSNLDFDITKTTKLGINISGSYGVSTMPNSKNEEFMYSGLYRVGPMQYYPIHEDGTYGDDLSGQFELRNPVSDFSSGGTKTENRMTLINDFTLDQKLNFITKGLSFKGRFTLSDVVLSGNELYDGGNTSQYVRKAYINDGKDVVYKYADNFVSDFEFAPVPWNITNYTLKDGQRAKRKNYELSFNYTAYPFRSS